MSYSDIIDGLVRNVPKSIVDFSIPRDVANEPTQASSNFLINKEQGDWAENLLVKAFNEVSNNFVAIKYGKSDNTVAGEKGFSEFFSEFQSELDTIGKRPDLLIFKREDYSAELGMDISKVPHLQIHDYVKKAIAGIEVRSSAFLMEHYESYMRKRTDDCWREIVRLKHEILSNYREELEKSESKKTYIATIGSITPDTIASVGIRVPGWRGSEKLSRLNELIRELKENVKEIQKRDWLSITPKVEDIKVVYKWIKTFNVPHFYFQVFFDKVFGISFADILRIISCPENEDELFNVSADSKNQNKVTIKIKSRAGTEIASRVDEPEHQSRRKELERGRLLFYVEFHGGKAYLDIDSLKTVLGINGDF